MGQAGRWVLIAVLWFVIVKDPLRGLIPIPAVPYVPTSDNARIDGPYAGDGYPDYAAWWNAQRRVRLESERNLLPALLPLFGAELLQGVRPGLAEFGIEVGDRDGEPLVLPGARPGADGIWDDQELATLLAANRAQITALLASELPDCEWLALPLLPGKAATGTPLDVRLELAVAMVALLAAEYLEQSTPEPVQLRTAAQIARCYRSSDSLITLTAGARLAVALLTRIERELRAGRLEPRLASQVAALVDEEDRLVEVAQGDRWRAAHLVVGLLRRIERDYAHDEGLKELLRGTRPDPNLALLRCHQGYDRLLGDLRSGEDALVLEHVLSDEGFSFLRRDLDRPLAERMLFGDSLEFRREFAGFLVQVMAFGTRVMIGGRGVEALRIDLPLARARLLTNVARARFIAATGAPPTKLDQLVPDHLPALPAGDWRLDPEGWFEPVPPPEAEKESDER